MIDRIQWSTGAAAGTNGQATATGYSPPVWGAVMRVAPGLANLLRHMLSVDTEA